MAKGTKAKTKTDAQRTSVTFLLDRSGSMEMGKGGTIEAFNAYLGELRAPGAGVIDFTFLQFDTGSLDKVCVAMPVATVPELTDATYVPRGGTPLIDAAYKTIVAVEAAVEKGTKVVVCVQTDGEENASREHTWEALSALIKRKTAEGWQFNFMGAGIDAYDQGARMGIGAVNTMSYDRTDKRATRAAFTASAANTRAFAAGARNEVSYSADQRSAAGDRWAPADLTIPPGAAPQVTKPRVLVTNNRVLDLTKPGKHRDQAVKDFTL